MQLVPLQDPDPPPSVLVAQVADGDEAAFRMLYARLSPVAYGLALRVTRDEHMAQDVLQEAFSDLWTQSDRFDPAASSVRSWVTMLTHRRAVDRVRREQSHRDRASAWAHSSGERAYDSVAEVVELRAEHRRVRQAMDGLTDLQRDASGRVTGRIDGVPSFREGKVLRVQQWLAARGLALGDFESSTFYSDSTNDLPLLEQVSAPVATNPGPPLARIAQERGWPVLKLFT